MTYPDEPPEGPGDFGHISRAGDGTVRLLWTASQKWTDPLRAWQVLTEFHQWVQGRGRILVIVHGDAPGGDQIGKLYAELHMDVEHEPHPANWEGPCDPRRCAVGHRRTDRRGREYCPAAGNYRNEEMVAAGAERCAALIKDQSPGATHCAKTAEKAGIVTRRWRA